MARLASPHAVPAHLRDTSPPEHYAFPTKRVKAKMVGGAGLVAAAWRA
jgi:hypothetical protein